MDERAKRAAQIFNAIVQDIDEKIKPRRLPSPQLKLNNPPGIENIYLAGKIVQNGWRHSLVSGLRDVFYGSCGEDEDEDVWKLWPVLEKAIFNKHNYAGPFFISDDHGCYHGPNTHGLSAAKYSVDKPDEFTGESTDLDINLTSETPAVRIYDDVTQAKILAHCRYSIGCSTMVFAWIDDLTAFGTIAELGYAHAQNKKIFIAGNKRFDDLWFVYQLGDTLFGPDLTPEKALKKALEGYEEDSLINNLSPIEKNFFWSWVRYYQEIKLVPQYELFGGRYLVDFAHLATKVVIELDGFEAHSSTEQIANDRKRQREIEADGWRVIRFGGKEIHQNVNKCVEETAAFIKRFSEAKSGI